jgi:hypothetical protein
MSRSDPVPASEFTRNFGRYKLLAQREPVAVSSYGQIAGYFIHAEEFEEYLRYKAQRRSFATLDLPEEKVEAIARTRMDKRHDHLNALLEDE